MAREDATAQTTQEGCTRNYFPHHLSLTDGAERMFSFTAHMDKDLNKCTAYYHCFAGTFRSS